MYGKTNGILLLLALLMGACMPERSVVDRPGVDVGNAPSKGQVPNGEFQKCRTDRTTQEKNICQDHGGGASCTAQCWTREMESTVAKAIDAISCPIDKAKENLCESESEQRCADGRADSCLLAADLAKLTERPELVEKYLMRGCSLLDDPAPAIAPDVQMACQKLGAFYESHQDMSNSAFYYIRACELTISKKLRLDGATSGCVKAASFADKAGKLRRPYLFMACALQDSGSCVTSCEGEENVQASRSFPPSWWQKEPNGAAPFKDLATMKSECLDPSADHPWVPSELAGFSFAKAASTCAGDSRPLDRSEACFSVAKQISGWMGSSIFANQRFAAEKCASMLYEQSCMAAPFQGSPLQACALAGKYYGLYAEDLAAKSDAMGAVIYGKRGTDLSCRMTLVPTDPVLASWKSSWVWTRCAALVRQGDAQITKACQAIANYPRPVFSE